MVISIEDKRMTHRPAPTDIDIHPLLAGRWSPRAYAQQPVAHEQVVAVLEAARWAPSAYNVQPWRFVVFEKGQDAAAFERAFATLVPFNQSWNAHAQVLIAVLADTLTAKGTINQARVTTRAPRVLPYCCRRMRSASPPMRWAASMQRNCAIPSPFPSAIRL